jgi:hypothetical protein
VEGIWILVLGLVWASDANRLTLSSGDLIKIERIEVATEADCKRAAYDWVSTNVFYRGDNSGHPYATCAGPKSKE